MRWVTTEHQDILGNWARDRMKYPGSWGQFTAIGLISESEILASVVYNDFYGTGCSIHIAAVPGRRWLTRSLLRAAFEYPFIQLGFQRLTGWVPAKNREALELDYHLGFQYEGTARHMLPDDDVTILGMLKSECRYINHGLQDSTSTNARSVSNCGRTDRRESTERSLCGGAQSHEHLRPNGVANLQE